MQLLRDNLTVSVLLSRGLDTIITLDKWCHSPSENVFYSLTCLEGEKKMGLKLCLKMNWSCGASGLVRYFIGVQVESAKMSA